MNTNKFKLNIQFFADDQQETEKSFTQEDLNNHIAATKKETRDKIFSDLGIEDIDKYKESQKEIKSKLNGFEKINNELNSYKLKDIKLNKALENGLSVDSLDLIAGDNEEAIENSVKKLAKFIDSHKPVVTPPNPSENKIPKDSEIGDILTSKLLGGK
ncbi:capsid assembly scaffolding protein Gp46 family protein [Mycoplasma sp. P36-A1]|uniref:capsid assembly scaffolding protein Gp46 family protein n=1 Tax=Mycoplasma sp. P36-A1 TaxID=3252900 RepID=UPI003C2AF09D